jgi:hypothetical protein
MLLRSSWGIPTNQSPVAFSATSKSFTTSTQLGDVTAQNRPNRCPLLHQVLIGFVRPVQKSSEAARVPAITA